MPRFTLCNAALAACATLAFASAFSADAPAPAAKPSGNSFEALDKNHDGKISQAEARANDKLAKLFSGLDADKDGAISREEYAAYEPAGATKNL